MAEEEFVQHIAERRVENKLRAQYLLRSNDTLVSEIEKSLAAVTSIRTALADEDIALLEKQQRSAEGIASPEHFFTLGEELDRLLLGIGDSKFHGYSPDVVKKLLQSYRDYFDDRKGLFLSYAAAQISPSPSKEGQPSSLTASASEIETPSWTFEEGLSWDNLELPAQTALDDWFRRFNNALFSRETLYEMGLDDYQEDAASLKKAQKATRTHRRQLGHNKKQLDVLKRSSYLSENVQAPSLDAE